MRFRNRWHYLAWFDVKRSRMWQTVICAAVVLAMVLIFALLFADL